MRDLSVRLFGSPEIRSGNREVSLQRRKDLALLIYLLVTAQSHRRDALAALLWEDQDQTEARSNLRKSLSRLKSTLGENVLLTSQDQVRVNPGLRMDVDTARFNLLIDQFHKHGAAHNGAPCRDCQKALKEAALVFHADFLAGFSVPDSSVFEEWHFFQSESFRKDLAEALEQLARLHAEEEDYKTAIEYSRRWLAMDRLNEAAHRHLITLYAADGQRAAAMRQFEECRRLLKEELDTEPEEETLELLRDIQKGRTHPASAAKERQAAGPAAGPGRAHPFPVHPAPFIGREKELEEIARLLHGSPYRLLTLLGPGGSGKTRLAMQVGAALDREAPAPFRDGIWFVSLAPLTDAEAIPGGIAQSLGMAGGLGRPGAQDAFLDEMRGREMLLILDNFEHLLDARSAALISEILSASPRTRILITSRERLNVEGEYVFPLGGLEVPAKEAPSTSRRFGALDLFEQSAQRMQPGFLVNEANRRAVVGICSAVQGMPLAIELAASWVEIYSPQEIHEEILRSLDFLHGDWRDLPERQRSLRAVFDSSWGLLDRTTRPIIKALSVFRSSFSREAAQEVSGASARTLLELAHKSWIQRLSNGRYQIHELLRQFALEKLEREKATAALVMKRYAGYYAGFAARQWEDRKGADQEGAFLRMEMEFDNIHTAWSGLVSAGEMDTALQNMLPVLFHYAEIRGKTITLIHMLDEALGSLAASPQDAHAQRQEITLRSARSAFFLDGYPIRYNSPPDMVFPFDNTSLRRAWTLAQKQKAFNKPDLWIILLAFIYGRIIDYDEGVQRLRQMLPFFERSHQDWELAITYLHLLRLLVPEEEQGSPHQKQVEQQLARANDLFDSLGDVFCAAHILGLWGDLKYQHQDMEAAIRYWQMSRDSFVDTHEWAAAIHMLWQLSDASLRVGDFAKAFEGYLQVAEAYRERGLRGEQVSALSKLSYETVRYGDIEEALRVRRTCLEIIQEIGPEYQIAWNCWEMGEVLRVMGDGEAAARWYERAYLTFDRVGDNIGRSYYFRGMGDLELAKGDHPAARDHFSTGVELARETHHTWMVCYTLSKLARARMELGDMRSAARDHRSALQAGVKTLNPGIVLAALVQYAEFCGRQGRHARAVELCSLVNGHSLSWHEIKKHASALLQSLRKQMPAAQYAQSMKRGRALDLWDGAREAINELKGKAAPKK